MIHYLRKVPFSLDDCMVRLPYLHVSPGDVKGETQGYPGLKSNFPNSCSVLLSRVTSTRWRIVKQDQEVDQPIRRQDSSSKWLLGLHYIYEDLGVTPAFNQVVGLPTRSSMFYTNTFPMSSHQAAHAQAIMA